MAPGGAPPRSQDGLRADRLELLRADPRNLRQVVDRAKRPVLGPPVDDLRCDRRPDAVELLELGQVGAAAVPAVPAVPAEAGEATPAAELVAEDGEAAVAPFGVRRATSTCCPSVTFAARFKPSRSARAASPPARRTAYWTRAPGRST